MKAPPGGGSWWDLAWQLESGGLPHQLKAAAPRRIGLSPLVSADLFSRIQRLVEGSSIRIEVLHQAGGRTLWTTGFDFAVWAQPNMLGVIESPPSLDASRQIVELDPGLAPLVAAATAPIWNGRAIVQWIGDPRPVAVAASERAASAGEWLRRTARTYRGITPLSHSVARRIPLLLTEPRIRAETTVHEVLIRTPLVAGLPGLVVVEVEWWHRSPHLSAVLSYLSGTDATGEGDAEGPVSATVPTDLPRFMLPKLTVP